MIIHVQRLSGGMFEVKPLNDDGSPIVRDGNDVPWRASTCGHGVVWDRVGELIGREAAANNGAHAVVVDYVQKIDPLRPLTYAPDFRPTGYSPWIPGEERRWCGQTGRIYTDREGWFMTPGVQGAHTAISTWYNDGPMIEVTNVDLDAHDERDGYGCLTSQNGFPPITDESGKRHRCVCGRWWELREVAGFVVWQKAASGAR